MFFGRVLDRAHEGVITMSGILPDRSTQSPRVSKLLKLISKLLNAISHLIFRCWLLLIWILVGINLVLHQHLIAKHASPVDAKLVAWWETWTWTGRGDVHHPDTARLLSEQFFSELGIAFIVAGLVGLFVESVLRRQEEQRREEYLLKDDARHEHHLDELKQRVFSSILGRFAPDWLGDKVVDLYRTRFLRQGLKITYTFEAVRPDTVQQLETHRVPDPSELLKVIVEIQYNLLNLTHTEIACEFGHGFEPTVPISGDINCFTDLTIKPLDSPESGGVGAPEPILSGKRPGEPEILNAANAELIWHAGETHECIALSPDIDSKEWKTRTISVRNFKIGAGNRMEVNVRHQSVRWRYDHDNWVSRLPAEGGLKVFAKVGSGLPRLEFCLEESHPTKFRRTGASTWELRDQVLPYQGFSLHWFPAPEERPQEGGHKEAIGLEPLPKGGSSISQCTV